ncbi:MAG TPA: hypothetical protein VFG11_03415 [Acidobacteriota bacterium]|nr:hypothetical protein [Acidobacteriota bacterium]
MRIEARGPEGVLIELRWHLENELEDRGYQEGPRVLSAETGTYTNFIKGKGMVGVQLVAGEEEDSVLKMESEQENQEWHEMWDAALIRLGKDVLTRIETFAKDRSRVLQNLK